MRGAAAAPAEAAPAAAGSQPAARAEPPAPGEPSVNGTVLGSGGEPETATTEWGAKTAGEARDEAGEAGPAGCEGRAAPGRGAEAASGAARRQGEAGSEPRSKAAGAGEAMAVSAGAKRGLAGCENEEVVVRGPGAGWRAGMPMARPAAEPQQRSRLLAALMVAGQISVAWEEEPGRSCSVPGALEAVPAALAAERRNPSRSHCLEGWGCWVTCSGCPGRCPWDRCCPRH